MLIILFGFVLADWKQNVIAYIPVISAILVVFTIDVAVLGYLTSTNLLIIVLGNILWIVAVVGGVFFFYGRRWPKVDEEKAIRIVIQYVQSKYKAENVQIRETKYVGLKWHVELDFHANTVIVPRLLIVDAGTGDVESDEVSLDLPAHFEPI